MRIPQFRTNVRSHLSMTFLWTRVMEYKSDSVQPGRGSMGWFTNELSTKMYSTNVGPLFYGFLVSRDHGLHMPLSVIWAESMHGPRIGVPQGCDPYERSFTILLMTFMQDRVMDCKRDRERSGHKSMHKIRIRVGSVKYERSSVVL